MKTDRNGQGARRAPCPHARCRRARACRSAGAYGECLGVPGLRATFGPRLTVLADKLLAARAGA